MSSSTRLRIHADGSGTLYEKDDSAYTDAVKRPAHYATGKVECWDAMESAASGVKLPPILAYFWFNIFKYIWRWPKKNGLEDLKKARVYLNKLIEAVENGQGRLPDTDTKVTEHGDHSATRRGRRLQDEVGANSSGISGDPHFWR